MAKRGVNLVAVSGNVGPGIAKGSTKKDDPFFAFSVCVEKRDTLTWVRCNAYGGLAKLCEERVHKGSYVVVEGELMNRPGVSGDLCEVRCKDIVFD